MGEYMRDDQFSREYMRHLIDEVLSGRMTRRQLLVRASVLGLSASAVGSLLAACGSSTSPSAIATASNTPKAGGTMVFAWDSEPQSLDPAIGWNLIDVQIIRALFEGLYTYVPKPGEAGTELIPNIAAAMPAITNGGKTYTIRIKPGVMFQAPVSREVTAEDFKYSFERMMKLPTAPGTYFYTNIVGATDYQQGKAAHVSGYRAFDRSTIQVDLITPNLAFTKSLMDFCDVVPREWVEKWGSTGFGRHPLGTGPFVFDHWTPAQEIVLKRNSNYRDASHIWLDGMRFELADDPQTAFLKLQRGEVDVLGNNVPPGSVVQVMNSATWKPYVYQEPVIGTIYLFLNGQFPPLNNVKVRQAISWAIDRDKLVKLLNGQAQALYQVYPPGMPGYQADKKWYGYDPEKAKQLLAEAGFANGFKTTLYTDNVDPYPTLFQSMQNDLANVGVKADLKITSNATFFSLSSTANRCAMGRELWFMDFPDPSDWIMSLFVKAAAVTGGQDNAFWWSPVLEKMVTQAQAMTDPQARLALYEQMQAYIMDQAPYVTLYAPVMTTMCSKRVGGFYLHEVFTYDPAHYWIT
jgi:ABC-type transport system substrate-binding protein